MKTILKTCLLLLLLQPAKAQSLSFSFWDLFSQRSKMRKIMTAQVIELKLYANALKTGYRISKEGLNLAHELKGGTFNLHDTYFLSLEQVSPVIRQSPKGRAITALEQQVHSVLDQEWAWQQQQRLLKPHELRYFRQVRDHLKDKCRLDMDELLLVLTPGKLQLTDAQRLSRLDELYGQMKDKQAFAGSFTDRCRKLALQRRQQQKDREAMRKLYGLP